MWLESENPEIGVPELENHLFVLNYGSISIGIFVKTLPHLQCVTAFTNIPVEIIFEQSRAYKSNGINLATNTMANWLIKSSDNYLSLLYNRLHTLIYDNCVIHAAESPVKVMRIDNAKVKNGKKLTCGSIEIVLQTIHTPSFFMTGNPHVALTTQESFSGNSPVQ